MQNTMIFQLGEYHRADKDYAVCSEIHPSNTVALFNRALLYFNKRFDIFVA